MSTTPNRRSPSPAHPAVGAQPPAEDLRHSASPAHMITAPYAAVDPSLPMASVPPAESPAPQVTGTPTGPIEDAVPSHNASVATDDEDRLFAEMQREAEDGDAPAASCGSQEDAEGKGAADLTGDLVAPPDRTYRNLFVSRLPLRVHHADLSQLFAPFKARTATIMTDAKTGKSKGFGFVLFDTEADGIIAHKALNKTRVTMNGVSLVLRTLPSKHDAGKGIQVGPVLYVRNVPAVATREEVEAMLESFGSVIFCAMREEPDGLPVWVILVEYDCQQCADNALSHLRHNTTLYPRQRPPVIAKYAKAMDRRRHPHKLDAIPCPFGNSPGGLPRVPAPPQPRHASLGIPYSAQPGALPPVYGAASAGTYMYANQVPMQQFQQQHHQAYSTESLGAFPAVASPYAGFPQQQHQQQFASPAAMPSAPMGGYALHQQHQQQQQQQGMRFPAIYGMEQQGMQQQLGVPLSASASAPFQQTPQHANVAQPPMLHHQQQHHQQPQQQFAGAMGTPNNLGMLQSVYSQSPSYSPAAAAASPSMGAQASMMGYGAQTPYGMHASANASPANINAMPMPSPAAPYGNFLMNTIPNPQQPPQVQAQVPMQQQQQQHNFGATPSYSAATPSAANSINPPLAPATGFAGNAPVNYDFGAPAPSSLLLTPANGHHAVPFNQPPQLQQQQQQQGSVYAPRQPQHGFGLAMQQMQPALAMDVNGRAAAMAFPPPAFQQQPHKPFEGGAHYGN